MADVPTPLQAFVDTTNAGDTEAFVALFTADAFLSDWGREFHGPDGARSWNDSDNIGKRSHFDIRGVRPGAGADEYVLNVDVSGDGFNGNSDLTFVVSGDQIASMVIAPD